MPRIAHPSTPIAARTPRVWPLLLALLLACSPESGVDDPQDAAGPKGDANSDAVDPNNPHPGDLYIVKITPRRGALEGGEEVEIQGKGFDTATRVYFGEEEAEVTYRAGTTRLYVVAPSAAVPGPVDVRVRTAKSEETISPRAFTYLGHVVADSFEPRLGPAIGGTVITVKGQGFVAGDRVLVGYRAAISSQVIDGETIVAITPPYVLHESQDRAKVVVAVRHASGLSLLEDSFEYGRAPDVQRVLPATVPMQGANVTLLGAALGNVQTAWAAGNLLTLSDGTASSSRGAKVPPRDASGGPSKPGAVSLLADGPYGLDLLDPAFAYVTGKDLAVYGVAPSSGSTKGGQKVAVLADTASESVVSVSFGGVQAAFEGTAGNIVATLPAHAAGQVDVTVQTASGKATAAKAYRYLEPVTVTEVEPTSGPVSGGNSVRIRGTGFTDGCTARIGSFGAKVSSVSANGTWMETTAPKGSAGSVDVRVTCASLHGELVGGYAYVHDGPTIDAVTPLTGATAGGTQVTVYGSGFAPDMEILFDGRPANALQVIDNGRATMKTPSHAPGPVTVDVVVGKKSDSLIDGYTYFSPTNPHGGTYGQPVVGTLNVTVLNIYSLKPLEKAWVQVGQPGQPGYPKYGGWTDEKGQVVFSGPDLMPPVTVSASKQEYSASSIVSFDAANATLLLFPWVPPSSGPGKPPPVPPFAVLEGQVLDLDKYMRVPPTNCLKPTDGGPQCDFCTEDADCKAADGDTNSWHCVQTGIAGKRCFAACDPKTSGTAADPCTKGFSCFADVLKTDLHICKPSLGVRKIVCQTSVREMDTDNPNPGAASVVDETTGVFSINARLDELAVYCVGGYVSPVTNAFEATAMGVKRHIFPLPGKTLGGLDIRLNIALKRNLQVRLDHPPKYFPAQNEGKLTVQGWLDLGSDGLIPVYEPPKPAPGTKGGVDLQKVKDELILPTQPLLLPQELTDTSYTYRAVVNFGESESSPVSGTLHDNIVSPGDVNHRVRMAGGEYKDGKLGVHTTLAGLVTGEGDQVLFATEKGYLYRGTLDDPYLVYLPPVIDPYEPPATVLAVAGTPTDATIVGEEGLIRRLLGDDVAQEKGALVEDLIGVCQGPAGRAAVGLKGGLQAFHDGAWQKLTEAGPALRAIVCTPTGAVAVGDGGRVLTLDLSGAKPAVSTEIVAEGADLYAVARMSDGTLWASGDGKPGHGGTLIKRPVGGSWVQGWPPGTTIPEMKGQRVVVPVGAAQVLLVDAEGGIFRLGPSGLFDESPERLDVKLRSGVTLADGRTVLVGQPGLWLGPFLSIPDITSPGETTGLDGLKIEWSTAPGPSASVSRVHVELMGFPFWWLYVAPEVTSVKLPDYKSLKNINVFVDGDYFARVDRIYQPGLSINGFSTFKLEFGDWRSWATNYRFFQLTAN